MRNVVAALGLAVLVTAGLVATPVDVAYARVALDDLSGVWKGAYVAQEGGDANTMDVKLSQQGDQITGSMIELNVFGDSSKALFLTSTLSGAIHGASIEFTKTYDGAGGVSHTVSYTGTLDATGRRIRGTYTAGDAGGAFELVR